MQDIYFHAFYRLGMIFESALSELASTKRAFGGILLFCCIRRLPLLPAPPAAGSGSILV